MKIFNTISRKKEELKTIQPNEVGIYACGPTVYSSPHIGNMYAYVSWDILVRSLRYLDYKVKYVMNVTDVGHLTSDADTGEDKMEKGSQKEGLSVWEIAKKYEKEFFDDENKLNIVRPDVVCKATDNIKEQIELIQKIEANGFAYQISDGLYFDTSKFANYADFAKLNLEQLKEGARVEINPEKRNLSDFALWKLSGQARQMEWESPWGKGFPGWHIECTAMSAKYLGVPFDIHTGGIDHIPVHHTNEIAQAYGAFGKSIVNYWMHNGFMTFKGVKLSKSTGGLFTISDLEEMGFEPLAFRYMVLTSSYRNGLDFSLENLKASYVALNKLKQFVLEMKEKIVVITEVDKEYESEFRNKIEDDLAMPEVIALVWKLLKSDLSDYKKLGTLYEFDKVLGFNLKGLSRTIDDISQEVLLLVNNRKKAREEKNWGESDRLRKLIEEKGYVVEDLQNDCKIRKVMVI